MHARKNNFCEKNEQGTILADSGCFFPGEVGKSGGKKEVCEKKQRIGSLACSPCLFPRMAKINYEVCENN